MENLPISANNLPSTTLHDYLQGGRRVSNLPAKVWTDIHSLKGIGEIFVQEQDNTLYYYSENPIFEVFSRGGRIIVAVSKILLPINSSRKKTIQTRFCQLDNLQNNDLASHLNKLVDISNPRYLPSISKEFTTGEFTLHMPDMATPFVEVANINQAKLVVPLKLIQSMSKLGIKPRCIINYANQYLLFGHDEDFTVRILYSAHLLDNTLFKPQWMD